MEPISVRGVEIGTGTPKIAVPLVGETREDILYQARSLFGVPYDLVEWRLDYFESAYFFEEVVDVLASLREILGEDVPLLVTLRTANEGGELEISEGGYRELLSMICRTGFLDLLDVELMMGDKVVTHLVNIAHVSNVLVVGSNHDFEATPSREVIIERLTKMQDLGCDLLKIAVMPQSERDVITLLSATQEMAETAKRPLITMSMGAKGVVSRLVGEAFGSAVTFGAVGEASAPGQIPAKDLATVLRIIHEGSQEGAARHASEFDLDTGLRSLFMNL